MSYLKDLQEKYSNHPNRVNIEDLKPGDFFVVIHDGKLCDSHHWSPERVWRCTNPPKIGDYSSSVFATCVSMANHVSALQVTCIYLWFDKGAVLLKLPKKQQTIYRRFYDSIQKNNDVHELGWSDWYREKGK